MSDLGGSAYAEEAYASGGFGGGGSLPEPDPFEVIAGFPTLIVEIAFESQPGDSPQVWSDVSPYAREISIRRGRQHELDRMDPGTCSVVLDNRDRRFDPSYTSSPYSPNVLPMKRVRIRALWDDVIYDLYQGFIDGWPQGYKNPNDGFVNLTATDAFKVFANSKLPTSVWEYELRQDDPRAWWRFAEASGASVVVDSIGHYNGRYIGDPSFGGSSLVALSNDPTVELDGFSQWVDIPAFTITGTFTLELIVKADGDQQGAAHFAAWSPNAGGSLLEVFLSGNEIRSVFSDAAGAAAVLVADTEPGLGFIRHIVIRRNGSSVSLAVDGEVADSDTYGGAVDAASLSFGSLKGGTNTFFKGVLDEAVFYDSALSDARVRAHFEAMSGPWDGQPTGERIGNLLDLVGWPAADRELDTGTSVLGPTGLDASALDLIQQANESEFGETWMLPNGKVNFRDRRALQTETLWTTSQATFGDGPGELPYRDITPTFDDQQIRNEVGITREQSAEQLVSDEDSQAAYLLRSYKRSGLTMGDDNEARAQAEWILHRYKDPHFRIEAMTVYPQRNPDAEFPVMLGMELGTRVTIKRRPQDVGSAISEEVHIEGISHKVAANKRLWQTDLQLSPADMQHYWQLEDATYGELGPYALTY